MIIQQSKRDTETEVGHRFEMGGEHGEDGSDASSTIWDCLSASGGEPRDSSCWAADLTLALSVAGALGIVSAFGLKLVPWRSTCHPREYPLRAAQVVSFFFLVGLTLCVVAATTSSISHGGRDALYGTAVFCFCFVAATVFSCTTGRKTVDNRGADLEREDEVVVEVWSTHVDKQRRQRREEEAPPPTYEEIVGTQNQDS